MQYDFFYTEKLIALIDEAFEAHGNAEGISEWKNAADLMRSEIARLKAELSELRAKVASNVA